MHGHKVNEAGVTSQIILVTQDLAQLSAFVRQLVDKTFRCTKLDAVGQDNRFRVDIYQGAVTGQNPPASQRLREMFYVYKPENFKFYKSASQSKAGDVGNEKRVDDRANILKGGKFKAIIASMVILPFVAGFLAWYTYHRYNNDMNRRPDAAGVAAASPVDSQATRELAKIRAEQVTGFLHGRQVVIAAMANYGQGFEYRFKVKDGDGVARFDQMQLIHMGYRVEPIGECAVRISGHADTVYALCIEEKSPGIVAQVFQPPKESPSM